MSTIIDTLIFDRTSDDVQRVIELNGKILAEGISSLTSAELTEYMYGMRGAYNYTDLNRIGNAIKFLADRFLTWGEVIPISTKSTWDLGDIPANDELEIALNDINTLKYRVNLSLPETPVAFDNIDYEAANTIERILFLINEKIGNAAIETQYTGMFYSGELG